MVGGGLKYNVIVCMVAFSKHHSHVGVAQMNRIGSLEPEAAAPSNREETQENPNNGSILPVCFHPGVWLHCNVNGTFAPETHCKWTIHLFMHFLLFLPLSLTLSVFGSRAQNLESVRAGSRVAPLVRRLQVIFWFKHGVNVTVFRQIGLPLFSAHLDVTTQAVWKHVILVFFT